MNQPQPIPPRRGAKRLDHGSILDDPNPSAPSGRSEPSDAIGTDSVDRARSGPPGQPRSHDALAAAKAAYDANPKVIFRGVDPEIANKLKAIYKHQLRQPDGIEGWSEWGRQLLADIVEGYETEHGEFDLTSGARPLRSGRVAR